MCRETLSSLNTCKKNPSGRWAWSCGAQRGRRGPRLCLVLGCCQASEVRHWMGNNPLYNNVDRLCFKFVKEYDIPQRLVAKSC